MSMNQPGPAPGPQPIKQANDYEQLLGQNAARFPVEIRNKYFKTDNNGLIVSFEGSYQEFLNEMMNYDIQNNRPTATQPVGQNTPPEPEQQETTANSGGVTIAARPEQQQFAKYDANGAITGVDVESYNKAMTQWNDKLAQYGLNPQTYNPQYGTVYNTEGQKLGMVQGPDGSMQVLNQNDMQQKMDQMNTTIDQAASPQDIIRQRAIATTGIDPGTVGQPRTVKGKDGSVQIVFDNHQQFAYYTGYITEQAKYEYENEIYANRTPASVNPLELQQQWGAAQKTKQAQASIQDLIKNPQTQFQVGGYTIKNPLSY